MGCSTSRSPSPKYAKGRLAATLHKCLYFHRKTGAGEGIRTLDPNLGKVVISSAVRIRNYDFSLLISYIVENRRKQ